MDTFHQIVAIVVAHPFSCYIGFNLLVTPLPEPGPKSSDLYTYFYKVSHLAAINLNDAFQRRAPIAVPIYYPNVNSQGVVK